MPRPLDAVLTAIATFLSSAALEGPAARSAAATFEAFAWACRSSALAFSSRRARNGSVIWSSSFGFRFSRLPTLLKGAFHREASDGFSSTSALA